MCYGYAKIGSKARGENPACVNTLERGLQEANGVLSATVNCRRTMRMIRQNLFWAFFYNAALNAVAAGILYPFFGILLNPMLRCGYGV
jgi:hypothetical protein